MSSSQTLVIACGGTGGHLFPGIAVAEEWEKAGGKALLLISEKKVDAQASEKYKGLDFRKIPAVAKPATLSLKMLPFLWKLWKTERLCRKILKESQAHAVLGMGGFTSLPPVHAGHALGLATYVHDSNALPGKANRMTARWCNKVLLGMEAAKTFFTGRDCELTGTPVRKELDILPPREKAAAKWDLDPQRPVILVMGGSQGAMKLNSLVAEAAKELPDIQFLHLTGAGDAERIKKLIGEREEYRVLPFCDDMASVYSLSDAAICRSGASSMTELAHVGLISLLVPYPYAADDHQTRNAEVFADAGAAVLKAESELDVATIIEAVRGLTNPEHRELMQKALDKLAIRDAANRICDEVRGGLK